MKNSIVAFITVSVVFYLAGAFTAASFNINEWDGFLRGFIAFLSIFFSSVISSIIYNLQKY